MTDEMTVNCLCFLHQGFPNFLTWGPTYSPGILKLLVATHKWVAEPRGSREFFLQNIITVVTNDLHPIITRSCFSQRQLAIFFKIKRY